MTVKKILNYFFSITGELNQKNYAIHFFGDFFIFLILTLLLILPLMAIGATLETIILFGVKISEILYFIFAAFFGFSLAINRVSLLIRRLRFLKMRITFIILLFIPGPNVIFILYLLLKPDSKTYTALQ